MRKRLAIALAASFLLVGVFVASASESRLQAQAANPAIALVNSDKVTFETSSDWRELLEGATTRARAYGLINRPCGQFEKGHTPPVLPATNEAEVRDRYLKSWTPMSTSPAGGYCAVTLEAQISPSDPAVGTVRVSNNLWESVALKYEVKRSTGSLTYLAIAIFSLIYGFLTAFYGRRKLTRALAAEPTGPLKALPKGYDYSKAWGTTTGVVSGAITLVLGGAGLLATYFPQYVLSGFVAANILTTVLIAAAPVVFGALYASSVNNENALFWASWLTASGLSAQVLINCVLVANAGEVLATRLATSVALVLLFAFFAYVGLAMAAVPEVVPVKTSTSGIVAAPSKSLPAAL